MIPAIVAQQTELNDSIELIDALSMNQGTNASGVALDKGNMLKLMMRKAKQVAGMVKAYASVQNDMTLQKKATISDHTFLEKRDDLRDDVAQEMHALASPLLVQLKDSGLTQATLDALQTRIDAYKLATPSTRDATIRISTATELLETELRRADMIQRDRLDGLMEQFSDTNETLYNDYSNARKLVNAKGGKATTPAKPTPP